MDGLFELLIILAIFLFPALEAWAKKRRQEQRRQKEGGGPETDGSAFGPGDGETAGRREGEEERAEELLPEDLWAELTGRSRTAEEEAAGPRGEEPEGTASRKADDWSAPDRELKSASRPSAGAEEWEEWEDWDEEPAVLDAGESDRGTAETGAAPAGEPPEGLGREVGGFPEPEEPRRADVLGEIGGGRRRATGRGRTAELGRLRPGRLARRGGSPAHAREPHPLVGELDRDALRRAVVYAEILAPPVSMREG